MAATSWVPESVGSDFPIQNLPYGVFSRGGQARRVGVAIGEFVLDLAPALGDETFAHPTLNAFLAQGRDRWRAVRARLTDLLGTEGHRADVEPHLVPRSEADLHLPFEVADFVDFYSSEHHARNVGRIFRPESEPLPVNWKHLPAGYHGRAGTVVVSGTPIVRPQGQRRDPGPAGAVQPSFGPTARLDIEAEVGFVVGVPSTPGAGVPASALRERVFGVVLVNDWSARDLQAWEYVPLGPFLGKSFATSISPWVVPLEALEHARITGPSQDPAPLPYLHEAEPRGLAVDLEVEWNGKVVSRPPLREMYWSAGQQLAHLTSNGASLRTGDLFASGTVSGPERDRCGSFLELTWNGAEPVTLADGSTRAFLLDGDTVTIRASVPGADGVRIGFGEVTGTVAGSPEPDSE